MPLAAGNSGREISIVFKTIVEVAGIIPSGSDTIYGLTQVDAAGDNESYTFVSDGTSDWLCTNHVAAIV